MILKRKSSLTLPHPDKMPPKTPPVILAFEASSARVSAAVSVGDRVCALCMNDTAFGQAASLIPLAVEALKDAGIGFDRLSHVAAGCGPGSFTGIRMALAAAKGVCLAQDLPGLGISGLGALAFSATTTKPILCLADTRRHSLYVQGFITHNDSANSMVEAGPVFEATPEQIPHLIPASMSSNGLLVAGFGADQVVAAFAAVGIEAFSLPANNDPNINDASGNISSLLIDAGKIATTAADLLHRGLAPPLAPLYLADARLGPKKTMQK